MRRLSHHPAPSLSASTGCPPKQGDDQPMTTFDPSRQELPITTFDPRCSFDLQIRSVASARSSIHSTSNFVLRHIKAALSEELRRMRPGATVDFFERTLASSGHGAIVTSHDLDAVARHGSSLSSMHRGELLTAGSGDTVLSPDSPRVAFRVSAETSHAEDDQPFIPSKLSLKMKLARKEDNGMDAMIPLRFLNRSPAFDVSRA